MLTKRHILASILALGLSAGAVSTAAAQSGPFSGWQVAQSSVSAAEAKSIARKVVRGGEVVDISRRGDTYRVRVIARNGKVVDVYIDANTGRVKR